MKGGMKMDWASWLARPKRRYEIENPERPNLLREIFPYSEVPKIKFDGAIVPMEPPKEIWITDTTFRDGQQARPPFTVKQMVDLYDLMHRLDGNTGVIRRTEFFLYSRRDKEAVEKCLERGYKYPRVTGWMRADKKDFELVKQMGLDETGILTSCSDYHIYGKLKTDRKRIAEMYWGVVETALEKLSAVRCHMEDLTRADLYGFVIPFVQRLMEIAEQAKKPVIIRMCDTLGYGVPWPEASLPRSVPKIIHLLRQEAGAPSEWLEWHGHNDFHRTLVNGVTAWLYGCSSVNGTLLGIGERTGNTPIEALVIDWIGLTGKREGINTRVITEIAEYFEKELGYHIPDHYPFVGRQFNLTAAGIHADGLFKDEEIYNAFDTTGLLGRPPGVLVTDKSGRAGIALWFSNYLGLEGEKRVPKEHPGVEKIYQEIMHQYLEGRVTAISEEELVDLGCKYLPEYFERREAE